MKFAHPLLFALVLATAVPLEATAQSTEMGTRDQEIVNSETFLNGHPDLRHRLAALYHYRNGDFEKALVRFKRGARFADKPSQGMVAEMLWKGEGSAMDRPAAYIWMDLAAERGYKPMLLRREAFWNELTEAERAKALEIGDVLFMEYADKYAKPRMERQMRFARRNTTGSRTGFTGMLSIIIPTPGGSRTIDGGTFYQDRFWEPGEYWRMQDTDWKEPGKGTVEIGDLQTSGVALPPPADLAEEDRIEAEAESASDDNQPR